MCAPNCFQCSPGPPGLILFACATYLNLKRLFPLTFIPCLHSVLCDGVGARVTTKAVKRSRLLVAPTHIAANTTSTQARQPPQRNSHLLDNNELHWQIRKLGSHLTPCQGLTEKIATWSTLSTTCSPVATTLQFLQDSHARHTSTKQECLPFRNVPQIPNVHRPLASRVWMSQEGPYKLYSTS